MSEKKEHNRWIVMVGALLVQLALGSLYAFSIFTSPLSESLGYKSTSFWILGIFSTAIGVFAITMIVAGKIQDRKGPRTVAAVGGAIVAGSYMLASFFTDSIAMMYLSYGVIGGIGIGLAYVCPLAAAVKWFPDKKGSSPASRSRASARARSYSRRSASSSSRITGSTARSCTSG